MARANDVPAFDADQAWGHYAPTTVQGWLLAATRNLPRALYRLLFALRRPIKYGVHHPLDVTLWGLKLRLLPRGNTTEVDVLFAPQFYDREELEFLAQALRPGSTFVDIGANLGIYSFWAHRCMRGEGRILAIEPDPEMRRRLDFNLRSNVMSNVEICPVALSDARGVGELLVNPAQRGENTLAREEARIAGGERVVQQVELDTLLHLLESRGVQRVDALKIDIEGHEPPVLRHFFEHAPQALWPAMAITEYKPETAAVIEGLFLGNGYRRVLFTGMNIAFAREAGGA